MITIQNLTKEYPDFRLDIPELTLESGRIYGLVGQNGAGKTTLIKCILGLQDYHGQVLFDNSPLACNRMQLLSHIAYISDTLYFSDEMKVLQVEKFIMRYYANWDHDQFLMLLDRFEISKGKRVKELSQGTKMKLAAALAIAKKPRYYLLDEPTSGLDPIVRSIILGEIMHDSTQRKCTTMFSTHILEDVHQIVDQAIMLRKGTIAGELNVCSAEWTMTSTNILQMIK